MFTDLYGAFILKLEQQDSAWQGKRGNEAILPHACPWRDSRRKGKSQILNRLGRNNCISISEDKTKVFSGEIF